MATIRRPEDPSGATMRSIRWRTASSPSNRPSVHPLDPPLPLHVHVVGPVHHDLGDLGVLQQELDGTEPDDLVRHLVHHAREVALRKDVALLPAGSRAPPRAPARVARCAAPSRGRARPPAAAADRGDRDAPSRPSRRLTSCRSRVSCSTFASPIDPILPSCSARHLKGNEGETRRPVGSSRAAGANTSAEPRPSSIPKPTDSRSTRGDVSCERDTAS